VNTSESEQKSSSVTRTYYALETFCENLGNIGLKRFLLKTQSCLMVILSSNNNIIIYIYI